MKNVEPSLIFEMLVTYLREIPIQSALGRPDQRNLRSIPQNGFLGGPAASKPTQKESSSLTRSAMAIVEQPKNLSDDKSPEVDVLQPNSGHTSQTSSVGHLLS